MQEYREASSHEWNREARPSEVVFLAFFRARMISERQAPNVNGPVKKILIGVIGIALAALAVHWIRLTTASDETRIRWLLEEMEEGFNDSSASSVVSGLSEEFLEESERLEKHQIRQFLLYLFLRERDPETKEFRFRVRLHEPDIQVALPDAREATVRLRAEFLRLRNGKDRSWETTWEADIQAQLRKEDDGWKVHRSRHREVGGRRPF